MTQHSSLNIRPASQHDIPVIIDIAHRTWPVAYASILSAEALNYMLGYFYSEEALRKQMAEGQTFFLALQDDTAIGFAAVSEHQCAVYKLNKLYVLPSIQKTGAGKALLQHAIAFARNHGASRVVLNVNRNNPAKGFYERLGFTVTREEDVDLGNGVVQEDYVMSVNL